MVDYMYQKMNRNTDSSPSPEIPRDRYQNQFGFGSRPLPHTEPLIQYVNAQDTDDTKTMTEGQYQNKVTEGFNQTNRLQFHLICQTDTSAYLTKLRDQH